MNQAAKGAGQRLGCIGEVIWVGGTRSSCHFRLTIFVYFCCSCRPVVRRPVGISNSYEKKAAQEALFDYFLMTK
jgi:hypothetical protein